MMMCYAISATKANRLFWLGRYTERVYTSLHLLRRCYDKMIDGNPREYDAYFHTLDYSGLYADRDQFIMGQMYDPKNAASILSGLELANDNAIVLREEIMSETLSYIQLSLVHLKKCAAERQKNITGLQPITDYLLAFWGSIDERVFDERIRNFLEMGRLIEYMDMHIRFDYEFSRIEEAFEKLKKATELEDAIFDKQILTHLDEMLTLARYNKRDKTYTITVLKYLNQLVLV